MATRDELVAAIAERPPALASCLPWRGGRRRHGNPPGGAPDLYQLLDTDLRTGSFKRGEEHHYSSPSSP
jgi:hypothetical protein